MFVEERHEKMVSLLNTNGKLKVKELSEMFDVTEDCIRKDLAVLRKKGLLNRTYGGAVLPRTNIHYFSADKRKSLNIKAKQIIAQKALKLIENDDTIFLDISTSNLEIAKILVNSNKRITVVSNMLEITQIFTTPCNIRFIAIGGTFNPAKDGFIGTMSVDIISNFKFDKAFIGAVGIDLEEDSVYTYDVEDANTKKAVIHASKNTYLVAENTKFNMDGNYRFHSISTFTGIITDQLIQEEYEEIVNSYTKLL